MIKKLLRLFQQRSAFSQPIVLINTKSFGLAAQHKGTWANVLGKTEFVLPGFYYWLFFRRVKANELVWVKLTSRYKVGKKSNLDYFVRYALPYINQPFRLITTDGDSSVPGELPQALVSSLLNNPYLVTWYTQNCSDVLVSKKFRAIPIGFDFHTNRCGKIGLELVSLLNQIKNGASDAKPRQEQVFCDALLNKTSTTRAELFESIAANPLYKVPTERLNQLQLWQQYTQYDYVLSLEGNGIDCHRTWEALYVGCTVVVLSSELDHLYKGLNVFILTDRKALQSEDLASRLHHFRKDFANHEYQNQFFSTDYHLE
ncbi:MAG TPA: hypothetical protein DE045_08830 [Oceanospirillaceae bacterium]|nr:hypothetical protein [Oceanospirillaceae bacterium]